MSPNFAPRFRLLFDVAKKMADSEPYKALSDIARADTVWTQYYVNLLVECGSVLRELASRHSDPANTLTNGLSKNSLRSYDHVNDPNALALSHGQRVDVA